MHMVQSLCNVFYCMWFSMVEGNMKKKKEREVEK